MKLPGLRSVPFLLLLALLSSAVIAQESPVLSHNLSFASYYSDGDYGEPFDSEIQYFPISYGANYGKLGFQLMVPYLQVTGLGNVLVNVGGIDRAVAGTQMGASTGIGDSILSLSYQMDPITSADLFFDLRLGIKLPTADEYKALGTGEADYSAQLSVSKNIGRTVVFATAGYSFRGKSDIYQGLKDSAFTQVGVARSLSAGVSIGMFYDFRQHASIFSKEIHELAPYFSWRFSPNWTFTGMTSWGFTDASADVTALGQFSYQW